MEGASSTPLSRWHSYERTASHRSWLNRRESLLIRTGGCCRCACEALIRWAVHLSIGTSSLIWVDEVFDEVSGERSGEVTFGGQPRRESGRWRNPIEIRPRGNRKLRDSVRMLDMTNVRSKNTGESLLDNPALAARLAVSERFVRRLVHERRIPYLKLGHFVRFDPRDIDEVLRSSRVDERPI